MKKITNHISGVWNSSDIGLDLGKLHNQIQTLEHSRLDFTAAGAANDFFHTFSNFISGKKTFCLISLVLILLLIIILPCTVRILQQNIQKLPTELHLAVLRNKKGGDAGSHLPEYCILSAALSQHHLSGSGIAQLEFYHCREPA